MEAWPRGVPRRRGRWRHNRSRDRAGSRRLGCRPRLSTRSSNRCRFDRHRGQLSIAVADAEPGRGLGDFISGPSLVRRSGSRTARGRAANCARSATAAPECANTAGCANTARQSPRRPGGGQQQQSNRSYGPNGLVAPTAHDIDGSHTSATGRPNVVDRPRILPGLSLRLSKRSFGAAPRCRGRIYLSGLLAGCPCQYDRYDAPLCLEAGVTYMVVLPSLESVRPRWPHSLRWSTTDYFGCRLLDC